MSNSPDNQWLHSWVESIDHRLELVNTKLDIAIANTVTADYCKRGCDVRKNAVDKRFFLGWGSGMLVLVTVIGLVIRFL